jgi:hypothetical protein
MSTLGNSPSSLSTASRPASSSSSCTVMYRSYKFKIRSPVPLRLLDTDVFAPSSGDNGMGDNRMGNKGARGVARGKSMSASRTNEYNDSDKSPEHLPRQSPFVGADDISAAPSSLQPSTHGSDGVGAGAGGVRRRARRDSFGDSHSVTASLSPQRPLVNARASTGGSSSSSSSSGGVGSAKKAKKSSWSPLRRKAGPPAL